MSSQWWQFAVMARLFLMEDFEMDNNLKLTMVKYWFRKYKWDDVESEVKVLMEGMGYTLNELKDIYRQCKYEAESIGEHGFIDHAHVDYLVKQWKMAKKRKRR